MNYRSKPKGSYGSQIRRARKVQANRSDHAKAIDRSLKAPKARSVDEWLSAPNRFDLPTVDTNKPQKEETEASSMQITDEKYVFEHQYDFDRLINKDNIDTSIPKNKATYLKILEILEKNKIPYYIDPKYDIKIGGEPDSSILVLKKDLKKALKLTDKYNEILWKTFQ